MAKKEPVKPVIAGALEGLNFYLYNFTHSAEEHAENAKSIFDYMQLALLNSVDEVTRFAMPKGTCLPSLKRKMATTLINSSF